jgi:hypothetical protein
VEDRVDPVHRPDEAIAIADVADEEADVAAIDQPAALVELLGLVATEDPDDFGSRVQESIDEPRSDRPGSARDEDALTAK